MRAWEIVSAGGVDALALNARPAPRPGPGEIAVAVRASSINYRDLATVEDPVARAIPYPRVPNSDAAGEVIAVGPGVTRFAPGDRVAGCFFQDWADGAITARAMASALGGPLDGVLAEQVVLREDGAVAIPGHLSFEQAATLPCAALTAWNCLVEQGNLRAGQTVLLLGTGGASIAGLQIARLAGARVIVTSSSDEKLERAAALGADHGINYRREPEWQRRVLELTGGGGTLPRSLEATRVGGVISLIGVLTGGKIDPTAVMRKSIRLQGVYVGNRRMFEALNAALAQHRVEPVIDRVFEFADAPAAFRALRAAEHFGKLVVRLS